MPEDAIDAGHVQHVIYSDAGPAQLSHEYVRHPEHVSDQGRCLEASVLEQIMRAMLPLYTLNREGDVKMLPRPPTPGTTPASFPGRCQTSS